jgi:hypothetical protein
MVCILRSSPLKPPEQKTLKGAIYRLFDVPLLEAITQKEQDHL